MPRLFGTDGIRGVANESLSVELGVQLGRAVAHACRRGLLASVARPRVIVGRDTRVSGDMLEAAVVAGLCSGGADVLLAGVLPTPGVAFLVADLNADAGVVLSASHNPVADNGLKVFAPGGWKLSESAEEQLEARLNDAPDVSGVDVGRAEPLPDALPRYADHLVASVPDGLEGMRVVADCANGAAHAVARDVLRRLGVDVELINATADGARINQDCGATHPEVVAALARERSAIGLSFDGDADRLVAADEDGHVIDGDQVIALLASLLEVPTIVATVMSNQALRLWASEHGIGVVDVPVGDRWVLEALRERGLVLGGEQSGHVIRLDQSTTGDGILTALGLLAAVRASGKRLADIIPFRPLPQVLVNVRTAGAKRLNETASIWETVKAVEGRLAGSGRVLVRASGTEPLVRVMAEAPSPDEARAAADEIAAVVARELGD